VGIVPGEDLAADGDRPWLLRLFVAGVTARSRESIGAAESFVREGLDGAATLEVVDVLADPAAAELGRVVATPMLVRVRPGPERRLVGDLTRMDDLRRAFDL
jgi:circadian clock protein KaiB